MSSLSAGRIDESFHVYAQYRPVQVKLTVAQAGRKRVCADDTCRSGLRQGFVAVKIRAKLTVVLLCVGWIPLATATLILLNLNLSRLKRSARQYRAAVSDEVRRLVDDFVARPRREVEAIATVLARPELPISERLDRARSALAAASRVDRLALFDRRGQWVQTLHKTELDQTAPDAPRQLEQGLRSVTRSESVVYLASPVATYVPLLVPMWLRGGKQIYGYLWAAVSTRELGELLRRASERRFDRRGQIYLLDERLRVVAHGESKRVGTILDKHPLSRHRASLQSAVSRDLAFSSEYRLRQEKLLAMVQGIPGLRWLVVVEQLKARAYAGVRRTWQTAVSVGIAFSLVVLVVGAWSARRLSRPILALSEASERVARGDFEVRIAAAGNDEIAQLGRSFGEMVAGLKDREFIRDTFGRYVSEAVVERALVDRESFKLGGTVQTVTIMITDLRGFTSMTDELGPEGTVSQLNAYFTAMTDVIMDHGGTLSEFAGDSMVVFFGAPVVGADDPLRACACAIAMQQRLVEFNRRHDCDLLMGIGIDSGPVVAGNIGSDKRMKYGVVGSPINFASRLEGLAVGSQVLISEATWTLCQSSVRVASAVEATVKGRDQPLRARELRAVSGPNCELSMPDSETGHRARVDWPGQCYRVEGKQVLPEPLPCRVTEVGLRELRVLAKWLAQEKGSYKIEITVDSESHIRGLYGKVVEIRPLKDTQELTISLSAVPQAARRIIIRYLKADDRTQEPVLGSA